MKNLIDLAKELPSPFIFRDVNYVLIGAFFLVILNYLYHPNLSAFPNFSELNEVEKTFSFAVVAYFLARFCSEIGGMFIKLFTFGLNKDRTKTLSDYFAKIRAYANEEYDDLDEQKYTNAMEIEHFITRTGLSAFHERLNLIGHQEKALLGFSVLLSMFYSPYLVVISIALLIYVAVIGEPERTELQIETNNFLWSEYKREAENKKNSS